MTETEDDFKRMAYALQEIYEWTKDVGVVLDDEDVTEIFNLACEGLGIEGVA